MMRNRTSTLLLLVALILPGSALSLEATARGGDAMRAAGPVVLTDDQDLYPLGLHLELLEDPDGQLTIEQVSSPEYDARFVPSQKQVPNFGYTDSTYWVRFRARNETAETRDWRLELGFANMQHVALYAPLAQPGSSGPAFAVKQTGTYYPFSTRDVAFHHIVFKLSLPVQAEETFYLRFQNDASMTLPLTLWSAEAFGRASRSEVFVWGLFYGTLLILLGYSITLSLTLRDRNYSYYALFLAAFLLFVASFAGHGQQYLWPNLVAWNHFAVLSLSTAAPMTALLFTASFLELKARAPGWNRALVLLLAVFGLVLLLTPFAPYRLLIRLLAALVIGSFFLMLVSGFALWRRGYEPARYYAMSWTAFLVAVIVLALARLGLVPSTALTEQSYLAGAVCTALLLALALFDRINLLKSESEQANRELHESEERFRQLAENINEVFWLIEPDTWQMLYVSPALDTIWGRSAQELAEQPQLFLETIHPDDRERVLHDLTANWQAYDGEFRIVRPDGTLRWIGLRSFPVHNEEGEVYRVAGVAVDRTKQRATEAALIQAEQLTIAGKLAASVAHEINNPLQSVIGCLGLLQGALESDKDPAIFLQVARQEVKRTAQIVTQLRSLGQPIQEGYKEPTDLNGLLDDVLVLNKKHLQTHKIEVVWEADTRVPLLPLMPHPMRQVFLNLVLNAVDAMPGGGQLRLSTACTKSPAGVQVVVADNGKGIAPEDLPHLFEAFYTTKPEGLGVGLYVSQGIVQQHGGRIDVESERGAGSTFTVWLPA